MKKKVLAVLLTAAMCFSIAGCGKDNSRRDRDRDDEDEVETEEVETEEETTVATTTEDEHARETEETREPTSTPTPTLEPTPAPTTLNDVLNVVVDALDNYEVTVGCVNDYVVNNSIYGLDGVPTAINSILPGSTSNDYGSCSYYNIRFVYGFEEGINGSQMPQESWISIYEMDEDYYALSQSEGSIPNPADPYNEYTDEDNSIHIFNGHFALDVYSLEGLGYDTQPLIDAFMAIEVT